MTVNDWKVIVTDYVQYGTDLTWPDHSFLSNQELWKVIVTDH